MKFCIFIKIMFILLLALLAVNATKPELRSTKKQLKFSKTPTTENKRPNFQSLLGKLRSTAPKRAKIKFNVSYQSPLGASIPLSLARVNVAISQTSLNHQRAITFSLDDIRLFDNPLYLDKDGVWNGVIEVDYKTEVTMTATIEVYPAGEHIFISNYNQDYTPAGDIVSDKYINKYVARFEMIPISSTDLEEMNFNLVFTGKTGGRGSSRTPFTATVNTDTENKYILSYGILANLAIRMRDDFKVKVGEILVLAYDGAPDDMLATAHPFPRMRLGKGAWSPIVMIHEYGHYIQHTVYHLSQKTNWAASSPPTHWRCEDKPQTEIVAWSEGYAFAFGQIMGEIMGVTPRGIYDWVNWDQSTFDPNRKDYTKWGDKDQVSMALETEYYICKHSDLKSDEGRVAAMMYDLYDINNDDFESDTVKNLKVQFKKEVPNGSDDQFKKFFGDYIGGSDENKSKRYTEQEVLVNALAISKTPTLKDYIASIFKIGVDTDDDMMDDTEKSKSERARDIVVYNYGRDLL